jgi:hypothetical protein
MNLIRRVRRIAGVLTGLACAWLGLAAAAPAAFAVTRPPSGWNTQPPLPSQPAAAVAQQRESLTGALPAPLAAHIHQLAPQAPGPVHMPVHTLVAVGMPGWQVALIAAAAALIAVTVAVLAGRGWTARRKSATAAA